MYVTSCMQKTEEILSNLIQTLTSEARVLNPKVCGIKGRSPGGGCSPPPFYLVRRINSCTTFFQDFKSVPIYMGDAKCDETNEK